MDFIRFLTRGITMAILPGLFITACQHEPDTIAVPGECDTLNVTYNGSVVPIFEKNCFGCHSGPTPDGGIDLTDYEQVAFRAQNGSLYGAVSHAGGYSAMPKNASKLSDCDIAKIRIWISDTTFVPTPNEDPCDPDTVYFANDVLPLLLSSCGISGCHDAITMEHRVNLTNYNSVMTTGEVTPFDPGNSKIHEVITENDPDKIMPPPPKAPLTQAQISIIYKWIMQGSLNNACTAYDCDTINITFTGTIWPTVQNNCFGCHSGTSPSGGISLANYSAVAVVAANGKLLGSVQHQYGYSPMPENGAKLSNCKITQIKKWVENGYPNN